MSGDNKSTQTQQSKGKSQSNTNTGPWKPTQGPLKEIVNTGADIAPADLSGYQPQLQSYIDATLSGQSNPHLQGLLDTISDTASNTVGSRFAAAGRSFSPSHAAALGRAVTQGLSPYLFSNYNQERAFLPGLFDMSASLPYAGLAGQRNLLLPIASLGQKGQTSGTTSGTTTGTTIQSNDPFQTALGAGIGGVGVLGGTGAFGRNGWLNFGA